MIDIIIPTFGRADRLARVVDDAHEGTVTPHRVVLVVEAGDEPSVKEATRLAEQDAGCVALTNARTASYAGAVNTAVAWSEAPFWFAGADDLHFHPGWDHAARSVADDQFLVVGTNDLYNGYVLSGLHATHYLVDRRYSDGGGVIDQGPGVALPEMYAHQFTDTEFIGTAKARVRFRPCLAAVVEHLHFKARKSERDATYDKAYEHIDADRAVYLERRAMWEGLSL